MGDMGELFNAQREATRQHRADMLAQADTTGWKAHTAYHFSRTFIIPSQVKLGKQTLTKRVHHRVDWWPSGGKAKHNGRMVYGHRKVAALIDRLKREEREGAE